MSRIGRMHIDVPAGVTVTFDEATRTVTVKGPKGTLTPHIGSRKIGVGVDGAVVNVTRTGDDKEAKSLHGLYRMLIQKTLVIAGVGYKAAVAGNKLTMSLGYSHNIDYVAPEGITITCPDANTIVVAGVDKEQVGQVAAIIRSKRPVEPYHNYGIHYSDEVLVKKEGKTAGK